MKLKLILFLVGLFLLDQAFRVGVDRLTMSTYWEEQIYGYLKNEKNIDLLILGSCRASRSADSGYISKELGINAINSGHVWEGLGQMQFALDLFLSQDRKGKHVAIFVDDSLMTNPIEEIRREIEVRTFWWHLLNEPDRKELLTAYKIPSYTHVLNHFGLWKYRGLGPKIGKAFKRAIKKQAVPFQDNFELMSDDENLSKYSERSLASVKENTIKTWSAGDFNQSRLDHLIQTAIRGGLKPVLIVSPMSRYRSTDSVNTIQINNIKNFAAKYSVPLLVYLGNETKWALNDAYWRDNGHFAGLGAKDFTKDLALDLKKVFHDI